MIFVNDENTCRIVAANVAGFEAANFQKDYYIYFYTPAGQKLTWVFKDQEERDDVLEDIEDYYGIY